MSKPKIKVFISYAHGDSGFFEVFKKGLNSHLYTSARFDFGVWEDSKIHLGSFWDEEIQKNLGNAGVAILCVSANFLNSEYIEAKEFNALIKRFPGTLIIPVYFNHCNINTWDELSQRQFFKPAGDKYGKATDLDFAFCDLVKFRQTDGNLIPDSNIDRYCHDLTVGIEESLLRGFSATPASPSPINTGAIPSAYTADKKLQPLGPVDRVVNAVIIVFMILSGLIIFYNLLFREWDSGAMFKSSLGCVMFFGSLAAFIYNSKVLKSKRIAI